MSKVTNLAVFDLDGTLWKENSHVAITESYHKISILKKIYYRLCGRIAPRKRMQILDELFEKVPDNYIDLYKLTLNSDAIRRLEEYRKNNWEIVIVTNAPSRIAKKAKKIFNVNVIRAEMGRKREALENYSYNFIHVHTDNISDTDIVDIADSAYIYLNRSNIRFYKNRKNKKTIFV